MHASTVVLDRNGVSSSYVFHFEFGAIDKGESSKFTLSHGVTEAISRLDRGGLLIVVASNQLWIAKSANSLASQSLLRSLHVDRR